MRAYRVIKWVLTSVFLCSVSPAAAARAQAPAAPGSATGRTIAIVAVVHDFKYKGADAVILRRAGVTPHDVILVKKGKADARRLDEAVSTLKALRARYGTTPTADMLVRVHEPGGPRKHAREAADWAGMLANLSPSDVPGLGRVVNIGLYLPN